MSKTPLEALRAYCVHCNGGSFAEVKKCDAKKTCQFWNYRLGRGRPSVKLFRKFCIDCMGGGGRVSSELVRTCIVEDCFCFPYRFGTNPYRAEMSDERREFLTGVLSRGRAMKDPVRTRTRTSVQEEPMVIKRTRGGG